MVVVNQRRGAPAPQKRKAPKHRAQTVVLKVKKKKVNKTKNRSKAGGYASLYRAAVLNPFMPNSRGIKTPDGFSFPTESRSLKGRISVSANGGAAALAFIANPVVSVLDLSQFLSGSTIIASGSVSTISGANPSIRGGTNVSAMANQFESYRVVAGGVKLRVTMPELVRTGIVTCAPFISTANTPGPRALTATMTDPNMYSSMIGGILPAVAASPAILELPGAFEMSLSDLGREDLVLPFKPVSAVSNSFHMTETSCGWSAGNGAFGQGIIATGAGTVANATVDFTDIQSAAGFSGWLVYVDGIPAGNGDNVINVEYVYHLEGVPAIAGGAAAVPVPDSAPTPRVTAMDYLEALRDIAYSPAMSFIDVGLQNFGVGSAIAGGRRSLMY